MEYIKNLQVVKYNNVEEKQKILDEAKRQGYKWRSGNEIDRMHLYNSMDIDRYIIFHTQSKTVSLCDSIHNTPYSIDVMNMLTFEEFFNIHKTTTNEDILEVLNSVTSI